MTDTNRKIAARVARRFVQYNPYLGELTDALEAATGRGAEAERLLRDAHGYLIALKAQAKAGGSHRSTNPIFAFEEEVDAFLANASPVTTAEAERARIVAWLRGLWATDDLKIQIGTLAAAIESGKHMEAHDG